MTTITIDFVEHKREQIEAIMVKRDTSEKKLTKCIKTLEKTEVCSRRRNSLSETQERYRCPGNRNYRADFRGESSHCKD